MKKLAMAAAVAAVVGVAALPMQSQAWWGGPGGYGGGPFSGLGDMFGDIDANFSSRGWGRGSGYGYPQYGGYYGPYGGYGYPYGGGYGYPGAYGYPGVYGAPYGVAPPVVAPATTESK